MTHSYERDQWVERARAADILEVAQRLGAKLRRSGVEHSGACPACGGDDRFSVNPRDRVFVCRGFGGGDVIKMVEHVQTLPFMAACEWINNEPPPGKDATPVDETIRDERRDENRDRQAAQISQDQRKRDWIKKELSAVWAQTVPLAGTHGEGYLTRRLCPFMSPDMAADIRFHPALPFKGIRINGSEEVKADFGSFPAIIAAIRDADGEIVALHRTYLDAVKPEKLAFSTPEEKKRNKAKKAFGEYHGGLIRLGNLARCVAIGEGIETSLNWYGLAVGPDDLSLATGVALGNIYGGATGTIDHPTIKGRKIPNGVPDLTRAGIVLPDQVEEVILICDGDSEPVETWAKILTGARRFAAAGKAVFIHFAPNGQDFSDFVLARANGSKTEIPPLLPLADFEAEALAMMTPPPPPREKRFGRLSWRELDAPGEELEFVIDGFMTKGEKSVIGGPSKSGKTFLAVHAGMSIALGTPFFGNEIITQGLVVYQAGEGARGIKNRLRAYRKHFNVPRDADVPFELLMSRVDLYRPDGDTGALIEAIHNIRREWPHAPLAAVFIDTLATATGGADENSGKDMSVVMANIDRISRETGAHVCLVHHMNSQGTKLRGHTSIYANVDQVVLVNADEVTKVKTAVLDKQKDAEDGVRIRFELMSTQVGTRQRDGKDITSCVCLPVGEKDAIRKEEEKKGFPIRDAERLFFDAFWAAAAKHGRPVPPDLDIKSSVSEVVPWFEVRAAYGKMNPSSEIPTEQTPEERVKSAAAHREKLKKQLGRAREALIKFDVIRFAGEAGEWVYWTDRPVRGYPQTQRATLTAHTKTHCEMSEAAEQW